MKNLFIKIQLIIATFLGFAFLNSCNPSQQKKEKLTQIGIKDTVWGQTTDGKQVHLFTLQNAKGMVVKITDFGGIVTSILAPDKDGKFDDVVLGFDSLAPYFINNPHFGGIIGRYANRIGNATFILDGKKYRLVANDGKNTLHGGVVGFDKKLWSAEKFSDSTKVGIHLSLLSPDGDQGFPGNLKVTVTYTLTNANELKIDYEATTDKATPINLTHHSYFNLAGAGNGNILAQSVMINAEEYVPVNSSLIPTGEMKTIRGTDMNFLNAHPIGERINNIPGVPGGYDHTYVIRHKKGDLNLAATAYDSVNKRFLEILTTEPGVQFYTGNFLDGTLTGKGGKVYNKYYGFCLETQHFPDSPNQPDFPSTILKPGEIFTSHTVYQFSVR
jgi:aldose 1-epimerase